MGCAASKDDVVRTQQQPQPNAMEQLAKTKKEVKMLLLGTGESGKSTTARQLQIIYLKKLNEEMGMMGRILQQNLIHGIQILIRGAVEVFELEIDDKNQMASERLNNLSEQAVITADIARDIKALWADEAVQSTFSRANLLQLPYSMPYLIQNMDRIAQPGFLANDTDVLMARARTAGIIETAFELDGVPFRVLDVGGQRNERKKWVHCFDGVTALLFCVALNEFDETLYEDNTVNRMQESMNMFSDICNNKFLIETPIIIFFNKSDLLKQKLAAGHSLTSLFPEYTGGADFDTAVTYIETQYVSLCKIPYKTLYSYVTCATDTNSVKAVFEATSRILQKRQLEAQAHGSPATSRR